MPEINVQDIINAIINSALPGAGQEGRMMRQQVQLPMTRQRVQLPPEPIQDVFGAADSLLMSSDALKQRDGFASYPVNYYEGSNLPKLDGYRPWLVPRMAIGRTADRLASSRPWEEEQAPSREMERRIVDQRGLQKIMNNGSR